MAEDALAVDRREFLIAGVAGLATAAGCTSNGGSGSGDGNETEEELEPVQVGYGGVPVEATATVQNESDPDADPNDSTSDPDDATGDGNGGGGSDGGGGYGGGGSGGGSSGGDDTDAGGQPDVTYVVVDGVVYGARYEGQSAEESPHDDLEEDPCLGYGNGPYGGVVEEGETPACREVDA